MSKSIKEKIKKLLTLANDAGATEAEAAVALQKATALMAKHSIESVDDEPDIITMVVEVRQKYLSVVGKTAGDLSNVFFVITGKGEASWMGRKEHVEAAAEMYRFINLQIEALYKRDLPRGLTVSQRSNYRRTYKVAAAGKVWRRSVEILKQLRENDDHALEYTGSNALVVTSAQDQLSGEIEDFLKDKGIEVTSKKRRHSMGSGSLAGLKAGAEVEINRGVE